MASPPKKLGFWWFDDWAIFPNFKTMDYYHTDSIRLYNPLKWERIFFESGNDTWHRAKPVEGLHKDPRIQDQLSEEQKETFEILDRRLLGMPNQALIAASMHYARMCDMENNLYVLAKSEFRDPRSSLRAGNNLSACAEDAFKFILKTCQRSFTDYTQCLEYQHGRQAYCRKEQFKFDLCMSDNGVEKGRLGTRETIIDDKDVPWKKPKNPMNYRVAKTNKDNYIDMLRPLGVLPTNEAFKDFVQRQKQVEIDMKYENRYPHPENII